MSGEGGRRRTSWVKGQTGNPSGKNGTACPEVRELAKTHTIAAVERLVFWMKNGDAVNSIRAAEALLNRGWGKPAQEVVLTGDKSAPVQLIIDVKPITGSS